MIKLMVQDFCNMFAPVLKPVEAEIVAPGLAIHFDCPGSGETITHMTSGLYLINGLSHRTAHRVAKKLAALGDWTFEKAEDCPFRDEATKIIKQASKGKITEQEVPKT